MALDNRDFLHLAKLLIRVNDHAPEARRYLLLRRRQRKLRKLIERIKSAERHDNILGQIGFTPPLSVAGENSLIIVMAEVLARDGIPVAMELDAKGRHRGTAVDEVRRRLAARGPLPSDRQIMEAYRAYMQAGPPAPAGGRHARAAGRLKAVAEEREALEGLMGRVLDEKYNRRRFMVLVESAKLAAALRSVPIRPEVLIAWRGGNLLVDGVAVPVIEGDRGGAQTVHRGDLDGLCALGGQVVAIDCHAVHWVAWVSGAEDGKAVERGPLMFGYPGLAKERMEADASLEDNEEEEG